MGSPGNIPQIHQRALQEQEKENSLFPLSSTHYQPAAPLFHTNSKELSQWDLPEPLWIWFGASGTSTVIQGQLLWMPRANIPHFTTPRRKPGSYEFPGITWNWKEIQKQNAELWMSNHPSLTKLHGAFSLRTRCHLHFRALNQPGHPARA